MLDWGHVRLFSSWRYNIDAAGRALLERRGWQEPPADAFPTGRDLYEQYLKPLAETPEMRAVIETGTVVKAITRQGADKVVTADRDKKPFELDCVERRRRPPPRRRAGRHRRIWHLEDARIRSELLASSPKARKSIRSKIAYGLPDVLGRDRVKYEGRTTLVIGAGHSAANVLVDLVELARRNPRTTVLWVTRGTNLARVYGGGPADQLPARGELGAHVKDLVDARKITLVTGFSATAVRAAGEQVVLEGETADGLRALGPVDRIIVATGQRPDLTLTRELRIELDPWLESARALGPLIDPNIHSCGSVPPHGHRELSHPEAGFYTVGVKSYGRAPTFLLMTGYEQVRSVAAAIAGDMEAADDVRLVLPETGVCTTQFEPVNAVSVECCGGPAPPGVDACCVADAQSKASTGRGCGCGGSATRSEKVIEPA